MFWRKKASGEETEWDPTFEPLMKLILGKKGVKQKSASEVGRKKVDYFRGKDFKKFLTEHGAVLKKKCPEALKAGLPSGTEVPETDEDVEKLGDELIQRNFCFRALYKPLNPNSTDSKKKWPDRLIKSQSQKFDCEGFYVITYSSGKGMQHLMLALIIAFVLLACLFPVWPMWAKIGTWYFSVAFLSLYFGILIVRCIIFTLFWIIGLDFWIFPNINDEYCGFVDSFKPFYSLDRREDDVLMVLVRFGSLAILAVAVQQIAETHSMSDVNDFFQAGYSDLLEWGVEKITALPEPEKTNLPSIEELKQEELADAEDTDFINIEDMAKDSEEDDAEEVESQ